MPLAKMRDAILGLSRRWVPSDNAHRAEATGGANNDNIERNQT
jgi:hypothetical protein